jgi:L,D-transpeptidase ErfK/SrfK
LVVLILLLALPGPLCADVFLNSGADSVFGRIETYKVAGDESLIEIARNFGVGFNAVAAANPDLDPFVPGIGTDVTIPTQWVLPDVNMRAPLIVVNLSEYRLYYFFHKAGQRRVATFPVGIGDDGKTTPLGWFSVRQKLVRPAWVPPPSVREEDPTLPRVVPSGPENPLGSHALRLSLRTMLIHGTHRPFGVGRKVSHGCVRLYPEDIPVLYRLADIGTRVLIVRQPVKIGKTNGRVYLEAHDDPDFRIDYLVEARRIVQKKHLDRQVSMKKVRAALKARDGLPVDVTCDAQDNGETDGPIPVPDAGRDESAIE